MLRVLLGIIAVGVTGPALAGTAVVNVPAPDLGGGVMGMLLAVGAVYLIKRRGR